MDSSQHLAPPDSESLSDTWLDAWGNDPDAPAAGRWTLIQETIAPALQWPSRIWAYLRTSPGRLAAISTILVVAIIAAGGALAYTSAQRQNDLNYLVKNTEPLSNAAQSLYGSLSVADSTATIGFLQGGVGSQTEDDRFNDAIQTATTSLVEAGAGTDTKDTVVLELLASISQKLPVYTSIIGQARANNRSGNPVGAAYLTEASSIMQQDIIPAASKLYEITSQRVRDQERSLTRPMWFPASGMLAAIIMLILAQLWLTALTNRRLNAGLLVSTLAMVLALVWLVVSSIISIAVGESNFNKAATPLHDITAARISAQQARTDEALMLVRRSTTDSNESFTDSVDYIQKTLSELRDNGSLSVPEETMQTALASANSWKLSHQEMANRLNSGDYAGAVKIAVGQDRDQLNSEKQFVRLDESLRDLIQDTRSNLRSYLQDGQRHSQQLTQLVFVLSVIAVAGVILGIRPRLQEYT